MFFQRAHLNELVERVARAPLERDATRKLSFLLLDPLTPGVLSDIIVLRPELGSPNHCFPRHLAFGVVDNGLEYRLDAERFDLLKKLFRQLESLSFYYPEVPAPRQLASEVSTRFWQLYRGYLSLDHLLEERELSNLELSALVEELLLSLSDQPELLVLLMQHRLRLWNNPGRARLLQRIARTVEQGLQNEPWNEDAIALDLDEPIRFRRTCLEDSAFRAVSERIEEILESALKPPHLS